MTTNEMTPEEALRIMAYIDCIFDGTPESAARVDELIDRLIVAPETFWYRFERDMADRDGVAQRVEELLRSGAACSHTTPEEFGRLTGYLITQRPAETNPSTEAHE